ncbi:hypothetical protein CLOP_g15655, partial [Closterium sp. NIES-67]
EPTGGCSSSIATGSSSIAAGSNSIAAGSSSKATGSSSIATASSSSIATGNSSIATGSSSSIATGSSSTATAQQQQQPAAAAAQQPAATAQQPAAAAQQPAATAQQPAAAAQQPAAAVQQPAAAHSNRQQQHSNRQQQQSNRQVPGTTLLGRPSRGSTHSAFAISRMASQSAANLPPSDSRASSVGSGLRPEGSATLGRAKALSRSDTFFLREMRATEVLGSAVVAPDNGYLLLWQQLVLVLSFYSAFITPLEFSFLPVLPPGLAMADNIINAFFLADLLLTLLRRLQGQADAELRVRPLEHRHQDHAAPANEVQEHADDRGSGGRRVRVKEVMAVPLRKSFGAVAGLIDRVVAREELDPKYPFAFDHVVVERAGYLCTFFACDVLALFPWDTFFQLAGGEGDDNLLRWFLWTRVVRTRHVMNYFHRLQRDIRLSYFAVRVVKLIFVELYITHVAGCFFYFLATTYPPDQEGSTWIGSLTLGDLQYTDFRDIDLYTRYFTALYWSVITMATIGYGDVHPVNPREMVFAMVYISFDLVLSAYLVGNITAMVVKGSNTTRYREKMSALIKYMNRNHLPHALRQQMRQHVRLQFETEQVEDEVMEEFPLSIRHKVARALYQRTVEACYLFDGCSGECINQIVSGMRHVCADGTCSTCMLNAAQGGSCSLPTYC